MRPTKFLKETCYTLFLAIIAELILSARANMYPRRIVANLKIRLNWKRSKEKISFDITGANGEYSRRDFITAEKHVYIRRLWICYQSYLDLIFQFSCARHANRTELVSIC